MQLVRTTLRLKPNLKKAAERKALDNNTTLQEIFNNALEDYLSKHAQAKAKKIVFKTYNIGKPLDNLTRADYYSKPS
jgi:hypothetical protein